MTSPDTRRLAQHPTGSSSLFRLMELNSIVSVAHDVGSVKRAFPYFAWECDLSRLDRMRYGETLLARLLTHLSSQESNERSLLT